MAMPKATLYLLLGLPGAGKTTTAKVVSDITGAVHLSSDSFRLSLFKNPKFTPEEHDALYKVLDYMCELMLKNGHSVVYDANLNRHQHRLEKYRLAKRLNVPVKLLWVDVHRDTAKTRRISEQNHALVAQHETPHDMFERIADIFEPPKSDEKFIKLDGTKITKDYVLAKI